MRRRTLLHAPAAAWIAVPLGALGALAPFGAPVRADDVATTTLPAIAEVLAGGGHLLLIRHASTVPGVGDPPGFDIARCETQRNLSDAGRAEARRLGAAVRASAIQIAEVRSSAWCRCKDTADLAFGRHVVWAPINSFFGAGDRRDRQSREVVRLGESVLETGRTIVLVTHQVNITALTGVYPSQGEIVVARHDDGRLVPRYRIRIE